MLCVFKSYISKEVHAFDHLGKHKIDSFERVGSCQFYVCLLLLFFKI